jgi:hypothetical protein
VANTPSIILSTTNEASSVTGSNPHWMPISATRYKTADDFLSGVPPETATQHTIRVAGVFSKLYVRVSSNSKTAATTIKLRKNVADATQVITIPSSTTGVFEDTTHTDSVVAGDEVNYQYSSTDTVNDQSINIISMVFLASSNTSTFLQSYNTVSVNVTTTTRYQGINGLYESINTTEQNAKAKIQTACTMRYLLVNVLTSSTGTVTVRLRKNGVDGSSVVTSTAATTGIFEDTTNSDTIAAGDDVCFSVVGSTASGTRAISLISLSMMNTNNKFLLGGVDANGTEGTINFNTTSYVPISGRPFRTTTENNTKVKSRYTKMSLSQLTVQVTANTVNGTSTIRTRKNGASGAQSVSIGASTTGFFTDSTNSDFNLVSTDDINYQVVTGGSSGNMSVRYYSVLGDTTLSTTYSYSPSDPAITASQSISRLKNAVRTISDGSISVSELLTRVRKANRTVNTEPSITVSAGTLTRVKKAVRSINDSSTVSDSLAKLRKYFRSMNEAGISANTSTLLRKVTRMVSEPASISSDSISRKLMRFLSISEPAITVSTDTIVRKISRQKSEPPISVLDVIQKKATKNMSEPAKTISDVITGRKVIRAMTDPAITAFDTMTQNKKKAVRIITDPVVNIGSSTIQRKISRFISDPSIIVSDLNDGHKRTTFSLAEPSITVSDSLTRQKKAVRLLGEFTSSPTDIISKKATKIITETLVSVSDSRPVKKISHFITASSVLSSDVITNRQKKATRNILEPALNSISSISRSAKKFRTIVETPIPNIGDILNIAKRLVRNVNEPPVNVNDVISRQAFFKRVIDEIPTAISSIISKTKISGDEKHSYKLGQKFRIKKTNDTRLSYTDVKNEFSDKTEEY